MMNRFRKNGDDGFFDDSHSMILWQEEKVERS
jgi:hypothetical protein